MKIKWSFDLVQSEAHKYTKRNDFRLKANSAYLWAWRRNLVDVVCSHMSPHYSPLCERFWERVNIGGKNECWIWLGACVPSGHGRVGDNNKVLVAHRVSWELTNGSIPNNLFVLHKCDNPPCVNPRHLFLGTQTDNMKDMDLKGRRRWGTMETHRKAKLNKEKVLEIRNSFSTGSKKKDLAKIYGVQETTINQIVNNRTWRF